MENSKRHYAPSGSPSRRLMTGVMWSKTLGSNRRPGLYSPELACTYVGSPPRSTQQQRRHHNVAPRQQTGGTEPPLLSHQRITRGRERSDARINQTSQFSSFFFLLLLLLRLLSYFPSSIFFLFFFLKQKKRQTKSRLSFCSKTWDISRVASTTRVRAHTRPLIDGPWKEGDWTIERDVLLSSSLPMLWSIQWAAKETWWNQEVDAGMTATILPPYSNRAVRTCVRAYCSVPSSLFLFLLYSVTCLQSDERETKIYSSKYELEREMLKNEMALENVRVPTICSAITQWKLTDYIIKERGRKKKWDERKQIKSVDKPSLSSRLMLILSIQHFLQSASRYIFASRARSVADWVSTVSRMLV